MIKLTKGTTGTIICTLTEKQTIVDANYLFVFTNRSTNEKVKFVLVNSSDASTNKERWNEFSLVVNSQFNTQKEGWFAYKVYEQASTTNTDEELTGDLLEEGLMFLSDGTDVSFEQYSQEVTFKTYDAS